MNFAVVTIHFACDLVYHRRAVVVLEQTSVREKFRSCLPRTKTLVFLPSVVMLMATCEIARPSTFPSYHYIGSPCPALRMSCRLCTLVRLISMRQIPTSVPRSVLSFSPRCDPNVFRCEALHEWHATATILARCAICRYGRLTWRLTIFG